MSYAIKVEVTIAEATESQGEIDRLRAILRKCQGGATPVDIGGGETIFLYIKSGNAA